MPEFNPDMPETAAQPLHGDLTARPTDIWEDASEAWRRATQVMGKELEERPIRTALISVGAGYLLGGGLFTPLTARLVGTGLRLALKTLALPAIATGAVSLGKQLLSDNEHRTNKFD